MEKKKSFLTIISNRAQLSMLGKGIIGLVGGVIMIFVTLSRNSKKNEPKLHGDRVAWVENSIIYPATLPNASVRSEYFKVKISNGMSIDSIISFISEKCKNGSLVKELNRHQVDSFSNQIKDQHTLSDTSAWVFHVNYLDSSSFLLVVKDSTIVETLSL